MISTLLFFCQDWMISIFFCWRLNDFHIFPENSLILILELRFLVSVTCQPHQQTGGLWIFCRSHSHACMDAITFACSSPQVFTKHLLLFIQLLNRGTKNSGVLLRCTVRKVPSCFSRIKVVGKLCRLVASLVALPCILLYFTSRDQMETSWRPDAEVWTRYYSFQSSGAQDSFFEHV